MPKALMIAAVVGTLAVMLVIALSGTDRGAAQYDATQVSAVPQVPGQPQTTGGVGYAGEPVVIGDTLVLERTLGGDEDFGRIVALQIAGDVLFVGDSQLSPHIAAVDLATGKIVDRVGTNGEGPQEFQSPSGMSVVRDAVNPAVWVHDFYNRRVTMVSLGEADQLSVESSFPLMVATSTQDPAILEDQVVAAGLYGDEAVTMFFDRDGRPFLKAGRPPFSMAEVGHGTGVRLVNRANLVAHPDGERVAVSFYSKNRFDVYSIEGQLLQSSRGPRETTTSFHVEEGRFFWTPGENELAYTDMSASRDAVFAVFCGCVLGEESDRDRTRIHVFGWDGAFQRELILPVPALRVAVDDDGSTLFTVAEAPWPAVYQWAIPRKE